MKSLDGQVSNIRSIKSPYELDIMERCEPSTKILEERVLEILEEGISEAEFATKLYSIMVEEGHHGIARFGMLDTEILMDIFVLEKAPFTQHTLMDLEEIMG